jgi:hypothetical protein
MPRVVITHAVQDVERWLGGKTERAAAFTGITNVTDLVAMDGSNNAGVAFESMTWTRSRRFWPRRLRRWPCRRKRAGSSSR